MILVDGHIHIYSCYDLTAFLNAGWSNLSAVPLPGTRKERHSVALLFTEPGRMDRFEVFRASAAEKSISGTQFGGWEIQPTQDESALRAVKRDGASLYLIAGRQISTRERLEVLALTTRAQFKEGEPLHETIDAVVATGAAAVLPWSPGKWMGNRGRAVMKILNEPVAGRILLGDISNRPRFCPTPRAFRYASENRLGILRGTDPLPFPGEERRVGSYGSILEGELDETHPSESIRRALKKRGAIVGQYGQLQRPLTFVRNQFLLLMKGRGVLRGIRKK